MRLIHLRCFVIAIILVGISVGSASAQEMMQGQPQISPAAPAPMPPPPPSNREMQIPQQVPQQVPQERWTPPPTPPTPPRRINIPMMAPQPVLPPVFRGCWQGTVEQVDSIQPQPGGHKVGYWTPKTYRLCYRQIGNGPYQLTFGETGIVASEKIAYSKGRVEIIATDGRSFARMHAFLHFDEYHAGANFGRATFAVDEATTLECQIDRDQMRVSANVDGRREDQPWFVAHWHTTFMRVPD